MQELEDRYYETSMAWEKELRDLISQSKLKSERISLLEAQLHEAGTTKTEYKHRLEGYQKDIQFLNNSLKAYGYVT